MKNISKKSADAYYEAIRNGHTKGLQEMACKDPYRAYCFARSVVGADIRYCQEMACKEPKWAYWYAMDVEGADLEACLEAVRRTWWEEDVRKLVIDGVIG